MGVPDPVLASVLLDRYVLQQQLGKKPGRRTLLALDRETQQRVVLKVLTFSHDTTWEAVRLFQREAALLKTLSHPSIPQHIDAFEFETAASKGYVIVQSYIEALSLAEHLQAGRCFSEEDVYRIVEAVLEILVYLHQRQPPVIHRDIKPGNVWLGDRSGDSPGQVYLVDFGSVQTLASRGGKTMTVVGTYGYMPPEQFGDVAYPASDLYSLGATAIALLTRTHPADLPKTGVKMQFEDQVSLSANFQAWLQWMVDPDVEMRPDSAETALQWLKPQHISRIASLHTPKSNRLQSSMTPTQLLWDAVWRSMLWGALTGAVAMIIFPGFVVLIPRIGILGAFIGALIGAINGVSIGVWTYLFNFPLTRYQSHYAYCAIISTALSLQVSLLSLHTALAAMDAHLSRYAALTIPAIVLTGASMLIHSRRIINRWYRQPSKRLPKLKGKQNYQHSSKRSLKPQ